MRQKSGPEKTTGGSSNQGHPTRRVDTFPPRRDSRRVGRAARRGEHCRTLSPRGHRLVDADHGWSKEFLEAGKRRLAGDTARAATSDEAKDLRRRRRR